MAVICNVELEGFFHSWLDMVWMRFILSDVLATSSTPKAMVRPRVTREVSREQKARTLVQGRALCDDESCRQW
jgi:hypothetical protein